MTGSAGSVNNILYVIILSAALDLVGPDVPKGVVLLADVIPSFGTKLLAPYFIHLVPYPARILICVFLSVVGMLTVALSPAYTDGGTISTKLAGVVLASLASGGGELTFVGLVHFYGPFSLAAWGSGTGAAGIFGAGAYALATTTMGFSVRATLLASACLPAIMVLSFFVVLPRGPLRGISNATRGYQSVAGNEEPAGERVLDRDGRNMNDDEVEVEGLLESPLGSSEVHKVTRAHGGSLGWQHFQATFQRARKLFIP